MIDPLLPSIQSLYLSPPLASVLHLELAIKCLLPEPVLIGLVKDDAPLGVVVASSARVTIKQKAFVI